MRSPELLTEQSEGPKKKAGYEVSLFPWMPLAVEETIPVVADWIVTMVDPVVRLKQMYITDIVNYKKDGTTREDNQIDSPDEQIKVGLSG